MSSNQEAQSDDCQGSLMSRITVYLDALQSPPLDKEHGFSKYGEHNHTDSTQNSAALGTVQELVLRGTEHYTFGEHARYLYHDLTTEN